LEFIAKEGRLDKVLQDHIETTRNQISNFIKSGNVKVEGKTVTKCGYKLQGGEKIEYEKKEADPKKEYRVDFDIEKLYEDDDILILNKPPFLTVHPAPSVKEPTLVDWLKTQNISLSTISGEERHGIVHRIDKQTSGALVVAKNNEAHRVLSRQLEDKSMGRYYLAIIDTPLKDDVVIEKSIARNKNNRLKMAVDEKGRFAKSAFLKLLPSIDEKNELIAVKLYTGRTHQIRVHLAGISRHIIGDDLYGFKSKEGKIKRVMLHAYILYLTHPTSGKKIYVKAPLFDDFKEILNKKFTMEKVYEKIDTDYIIDHFNTRF
jgi:23S rRNA pseudouridine1911/1915/1917 synthase